MARKWSNFNIPGALHFVTGNVRDRIPLFNDERYCYAFFEVCTNLRNSWPAKLIAYVLMPNHFHLIANPKDGDIQGFIGGLKGRLSLQVVELTGNLFLLRNPGADDSIHQVWQESFRLCLYGVPG